MDDATEARVEQTPPGASASSVDIQTTATVTTAAPAKSAVKKVVVAVHGVGDQHNFATIQSVVNQFCSFYRMPAAIPLGNFHTDQAAFSLQLPYPQEVFKSFAFAEVYWAKIPRALVEEKYTLEETKKWARTIVERLRLRWYKEGKQGSCSEGDFLLISQVLTEMIQTIAVLDRICFLADKAGVFTFDLRKLLDDYLGDVQVVAEFGTHRGKILDAFATTMDSVHKFFPDAEIHLVTHSEGTVVSFLGLLKGFRNPQTSGWVEQVRGFMTLGSPIDKHLILWPELFGEEPPAYTPKPDERIEWRNYYDHGDPIGFALDDAREWIVDHGWGGVFNFSAEHDFGFTRYPFPGKAHVDYWTDGEVFDHFISTVVNDEPSPPAETPAKEPKAPPADIRQSQWLSYVVPYMGVAALLFIAAYVLVKAISGAINPDIGLPDLARRVTGVAGLLLGVTVVARIPRLTRSKFWRSIASVVGLLSAGVYIWSARWGSSVEVWGLSILPVWIVLSLALLLVGLTYILSKARPSWGLKPLMVLGTAAVAVAVWYYLHDTGLVWPVVVATIAFLYLWWLAALLFDLIFVWHLYIRHSKMLQRMDEITGHSRTKDPKGGTGAALASAEAS